MKKRILILVMLLIGTVSYAHDPIEILKKSYMKCQSIKNGYYEMAEYFKSMTHNDTSKVLYKSTFRKLENDSLFSTTFYTQSLYKNGSSGNVMYTGDELVNYSTKDSSGFIIKKELWPEEIKNYSHSYRYYTPLTGKESKPLPRDSDFVDGKHTFKYFGEEKINDYSCHHIQVNIQPENDSAEPMKLFKLEYHYWINKTDMVPVQLSEEFDNVMNSDTMIQYRKLVLHKYELDNLIDESQLKLSSIPKFIKLKDFEPGQRQPLLPKDTIAPNWTLTSLSDETISLSDLKGKLVLIDFFYKSCYPCMLAIPVLQSLNEKYKDKGLVIIGIDPYDEKKDNMPAFLAKRGVTYKVFLGGKETAKSYRVSAYPTLYLIDKSGKIIHVQEGYGPGLEEELEKIIQNYLLEQ